MASISSLSSSASSIYGTRNVISGLASGMDTETLIENAVSGFKTKISNLQQKRTKVEWQQEAYRSIIEKMSAFTDKYTSYRSSTNLMSASFFNSAVQVSTAGKYADKVSASGKTSSDVQILGVRQLAKAASYTVSGLAGKSGSAAAPSFSGTEVNLADKQKLSQVSGSLTINYGGDRTYTVELGELELFNSAQDLADAISAKLSEQTMTLSDGTTVKVSDRIGVSAKDGVISFTDKSSAGNNVYISSATGQIQDTLDIKTTEKPSTLKVDNSKLVNEDGTVGAYLSGKTLQVTLDGVSKKITLPTYQKDQTAEDYLKALQKELDSTFGKDRIKVEIPTGTDGKFTLKMEVKEGSALSVSGDAAAALGLGKGASTYVDTSKTLGSLLDDSAWAGLERSKAVGSVTQVPQSGSTPAYHKDSQGNRVAQDEKGDWYRVDEKGDALYAFRVNGQEVGHFSKNSALESVITAVNGNADAGVTVSYSKTTNEFRFTAKESGSASRVEMDKDGLSGKLFGNGTAEAGQDAVLSMSVNGRRMEDIVRSSNTFDVDGLSVSLKGTFQYGADTANADGSVTYGKLETDAEAVTFTSRADSDKIVDAVKAMVEDYNAMVTEIKNAYSTLPAQKSNGKYYEPLTEEDKAEMSESAVKSYEEKAKQGLLFADRDLSSLYSRLLNAVSATGTDGAALRAMGITTAYSNGLTTLSLDESKLRAALDTDPDKVRDAFTKSQENGASTNGLMQALKTPLDQYGKTTGGKGILVEKAGSPLAPTTLYKNTLQTMLDRYDEQISTWQEKMTDQIDRYTSKFSQLEQLIAQMNSQSSMLSGLMGGY